MFAVFGGECFNGVRLRKYFAIILLALMGLPYASPLIAYSGDGEANVPVCCRKNGKHQCFTDMKRAQIAAYETQFRTRSDECPYSPLAISSHHSRNCGVLEEKFAFAELTGGPTTCAQTQSHWRILRDRSRQKRGPPVNLL